MEEAEADSAYLNAQLSPPLQVQVTTYRIGNRTTCVIVGLIHVRWFSLRGQEYTHLSDASSSTLLHRLDYLEKRQF